MQPHIVPMITASAVIFVFSAIIAVPFMRRLIEIYEAQHELKRGSAGWIRTLSGWSFIAVWAGLVWFAGTILGDWGVNGDLDGAIERGQLRFYLLVEFLSALVASE